MTPSEEIQLRAILEAVGDVAQGLPVSDFMLSFPLVQLVADLKVTAEHADNEQEAQRETERLRAEILETRQRHEHAVNYARVINENYRVLDDKHAASKAELSRLREQLEDMTAVRDMAIGCRQEAETENIRLREQLARFDSFDLQNHQPISFASVMDSIDSRHLADRIEELVFWHIRRAEAAEAERTRLLEQLTQAESRLQTYGQHRPECPATFAFEKREAHMQGRQPRCTCGFTPPAIPEVAK